MGPPRAPVPDSKSRTPSEEDGFVMVAAPNDTANGTSTAPTSTSTLPVRSPAAPRASSSSNVAPSSRPAAASTTTAAAAANNPTSNEEDTLPTNSQDKTYITLISSDSHIFHVRKSAATQSEVIKRMLNPDNGFAESRTLTCKFDAINGVILEKICEYFYYNEKYRLEKDVPDMELPPEICLELLMASDYLKT